jgi:hypothetical protein
MFSSSRSWRSGIRPYMFAAFIALSLAFSTFSAVAVPTAVAQAPVAAPLDQVATKDPCKAKKLKKVDKTKNAIYCTHGPDPAPPGKDITVDVPPVAPAATAAPAVSCDGDGVSGPRVQVVYARASDVADRYDAYLASFQQWATLADRIYQESAAETGGRRHLRFVHDFGCNPVIAHVVLSPIGDDTFGDTINELQAQGYNQSDRKYMLFVDANVYCGIGGISGDDQPGSGNANNFGPSYGRSDAGCWDGWVVAHELTHNLGGVQLSAPNTSGGYHCIDEYDVMCYSDSPNFPTMQIRCPDTLRDSTRLDCNHDDYYHTNPPANSYLATHWNVANNQYLEGGVAPPPCPDASLEPDNSLAQARGVAVGSKEKHAFCVAGDEDWIFFQANAGSSYRIETLNLTSGTDTILYLYNSNGTQLASNDDSGGTLASLIDYAPSTSGNYYVRSIQFGANGSTGFQYDLKISAIAPPPPGNLLVNASFDNDANADNRPDSWTSNAKFTRSNAVTRCSTTAYVGRFFATDNSGAPITQSVAGLTAGATYNFSGCVNIPAQNDTTFTFKVQVQWKNASNGTISTTTVKSYTAATSGWNVAAKNGMVAPAGTVSALVKMVASSLNGNIYVDDFVFGR